MKNLLLGAVMLLSAALTACGVSPPVTEQAAAPTHVPPPTASVAEPTDTPVPPPPKNTPAPTATPLSTQTASPTDTPPADTLSPEQQAVLASFPSKGAAPPVRNEVWLNSDPLKWESLAGKVVIVDFWTYG